MSAVADHSRSLAHPGAERRPRRGWRPGPGLGALALAGAVAGVALPLGSLVPLLGAPIVALVLGMALATVAPTARLRTGLATTSSRALQLAIVLLGATIDLRQVLRVGGASLPVMLGSLASALLAAALLGRALGVPERLRVLIGVGTGICGASAIAAVAGVVGARASEIRYAISTIFALNLVAVLAFPPLGHLLGFSQHTFGLWSGTAINDVSSVLAAGYAYGHQAGARALIVKLTRTTMIVPITLALAAAAVRRRRPAPAAATGSRPRTAPANPGHTRHRSALAPTGGDHPAARFSLRAVIPWFLLWFIAASGADTLGAFGAGARAGLSGAGLALTAIALAAVGLSSDLREMRATGSRPLALGALVWIAVTIASLSLQAITGAA